MKAKKLVLCILLSVALTVTFIPVISFANESVVHTVSFSDVNEVEVEDGVCYLYMDHGYAYVNTEAYECSNDGDFSLEEGEEFTFGVCSYEHYSVDYVRYAINGFGYDAFIEGEGLYSFTVPTPENEDDAYDAVEIGVGFSFNEDIDDEPEDEGNPFEEWSADWEDDADVITLNQTKRVDTDDKDGLFKFTAPEDGIYVFYSYDIENSEADPKGRVLDEDGDMVEYEDDKNYSNYHFYIYFEAEADDVFYLQATNYEGTATFMVKLIASDIESISFAPKKEYQLREEVDGWYKEISEDSQVWYWDSPRIIDGDKLTLHKKNEQTITYECRSFVDEDGDSYQEFVNINNANDLLPGFPEFDLNDSWASIEDYSAGTQTTVDLTYAVFSTTVTVKFVANPFEALTIKPATGIKVKKDCGGDYYIDLSNVLFTLTMSNGTKVDYKEDEDGNLFNEKTSDYLSYSICPWGSSWDDINEETIEWELGQNYTAWLEVAGFEQEIGIKIDNVISHDYEEISGTAKAPTCTAAGKKADQKCYLCGNVIPGAVIPAVAHKTTHQSEAAGYLKDGVSYDYCSVCGQKLNYAVVPGWSTSYVKGLKVAKGKGKITVKWKKQSKANLKNFNGYQIRYSTSPDMSGAKYTTAGKKSKSKKIGKLAKKTKYYVQVRTYTTTGSGTFYSGWSTKTVKTK